MQDSKHRNYDYVPPLSKQTQNAAELLNDIRWFMGCTQLKSADWILLNKLIKKLEYEKQSNKVLRSIAKKFIAIQQQYQR